jgi:hypothetical protein
MGGYARIAVHGFIAGHDFQDTIRQRSLQLASSHGADSHA